jgi:hypothetical protein
MRSRLILITLLFVALPHTANAVTPVRVLDTSEADEWFGSMQGDWFAWTANTSQRPKDIRGYVREAGSDPRRIQINGDVFVGDVILDGPRAGQVVVTAGDQNAGDIRFYDLATHDVTNAPQGVNTAKRETAGTVSGDYLAFSRRYSDSRTDVLLYRFSTQTLTTIASGWFFVTQVNGDYVTYMRCVPRTCDVWRYTISTDRTVKMPVAPDGRANYFPAVSTSGDVYYVQGDNDECGKNTRILRWRQGNVTRALALPDGTELLTLRVGTRGTDDVLTFTEVACGPDEWGIYRIAI